MILYRLLVACCNEEKRPEILLPRMAKHEHQTAGTIWPLSYYLLLFKSMQRKRNKSEETTITKWKGKWKKCEKAVDGRTKIDITLAMHPPLASSVSIYLMYELNQNNINKKLIHAPSCPLRYLSPVNQISWCGGEMAVLKDDAVYTSILSVI